MQEEMNRGALGGEGPRVRRLPEPVRVLRRRSPSGLGSWAHDPLCFSHAKLRTDGFSTPMAGSSPAQTRACGPREPAPSTNRGLDVVGDQPSVPRTSSLGCTDHRPSWGLACSGAEPEPGAVCFSPSLRRR